jgi:hypothetical protein
MPDCHVRDFEYTLRPVDQKRFWDGLCWQRTEEAKLFEVKLADVLCRKAAMAFVRGVSTGHRPEDT